MLPLRRALPGVLAAEVALLSETATVRLDGAATSPEQVVDAVEACGFEARVVSSSQEGGGGGGSSRGVETLRMDVRGMHCSACSSGAAGRGANPAACSHASADQASPGGALRLPAAASRLAQGSAAAQHPAAAPLCCCCCCCCCCCIHAMPLHSAAAVPFCLLPLLMPQRSRRHCSSCRVSVPRPSA